ncbi:Putative membrane protein [Gloeomargarita lithophora Alchichica-D10]|uniref:Membrane protein n=1 Tax=Gloeomargarita lithophora Alchichica-D10 TaxID=1188229 RepID=A0A1J0AH08_9CYAN|nr:MAPEG family protein [Gloeomargarita lithophora]APB35213.1 Putative membrane protein [Gloeomargarita lithophora Alchichica-D10]
MSLPIPPQQALYWAIAVAAGLIYVPYLLVAYGRLKCGYDPNAPRAIFDKLPPFAQRAAWAHQNAFESFTLFAPAVLLVVLAQAASPYTNAVLVTYLAMRLGHSLFYIANIAALRGLAWVVSMGCIASLYGTAISKINLLP